MEVSVMIVSLGFSCNLTIYRFLYLLIIAMDANFRLKNLMRSSNAKDPGLHTGMAYFPADQPYREHVLKYASQKDVSTSPRL